MYEHRTNPLISRKKFFSRLAFHASLTFLIIILSLLAGMLGYHYLNALNWIDAFVNASMILGGMGPVDPLISDNAKIFAGIYALFSGLVLLISVGILATPVIHRIMHKLHLQDK